MLSNSAIITVGVIPTTSNLVNAEILNVVIQKLQNGTASNIFVQSGDTITYTVNITNNTGLPILASIFTDTLPVGTTYVVGSFKVNGSITAPIVVGNLLTYTIVSIAASATVALEFKALVL